MSAGLGYARGGGRVARAAWALVCGACVAASTACSGEDERPRAKEAASASAAQTERWAFVDAFAALKSADPEKRLQGVNWIGAHLGPHGALAKEALRAAASDEDAAVAARAKRLLRQLGER